MMRYRGGGVGHKSTRDATDKFLSNRDLLDIPIKTTADEDTKMPDNNDGDEVEDIENLDGEIGLNVGENIWAGDEGKEPNDSDSEDDDDSEDDEDRDEAELEEEYDYGLKVEDGNDTEDNEESDISNLYI